MRDGGKPRRITSQAFKRQPEQPAPDPNAEAATPPNPKSDEVTDEETARLLGADEVTDKGRRRPEDEAEPDVRRKQASKRASREEAAASSGDPLELLVRIPIEDLSSEPAEAGDRGDDDGGGTTSPPSGSIGTASTLSPEAADILYGLFDDGARAAEAEPESVSDESTAPRPAGPGDPVRFARLHLRTGSLMRARSEYEALAAEELLDLPGTLDLAEVRWRTADLLGAGLAAAAYVAAGGDETLGFLIAAEAAASEDRIVDARDFAGRAQKNRVAGLQTVFAGIPRRMDWDKEVWTPRAEPLPEPVRVREPRVEFVALPTVEPEAPPVVEEAAVSAPEVEPPVEAVAPETAVAPEATAVAPEVAAVAPAAAVAEVEPAAEVEAVVAEPEAAAEPGPEPEPSARLSAEHDPTATIEAGPVWEPEVEAARISLAGGDVLMAALHLAVALRTSPEAARVVLDVIGDRDDLALELVRGDALKAAGADPEARMSRASVVSKLSRRGSAVSLIAEPERLAEPEAVAEPEAAAEPEAEVAEPEAEVAEPEAEVAEPAVDAEVAPQVEVEVEPEAGVAEAVEAAPEPEAAEPEAVVAEPEAEAEAEEAVVAEPEAAPEPEAAAEPEAETEAEPEAEVEPEAELQAVVDLDALGEPEVEPEAVAEPEPAAEPKKPKAPEPKPVVEPPTIRWE